MATPGKLFCGQCGSPREPEARFCGNCGRRFDETHPGPKPAARTPEMSSPWKGRSTAGGPFATPRAGRSSPFAEPARYSSAGPFRTAEPARAGKPASMARFLAGILLIAGGVAAWWLHKGKGGLSEGGGSTKTPPAAHAVSTIPSVVGITPIGWTKEARWEVLASEEVTPGAGRVEAEDGPTIQYEAGTFAAPARLTVSRSSGFPLEGPVYDIHVEGVTGLLPKAMDIGFPLVDPADAEKTLIVQSEDGWMWTGMPATFDPADGKLHVRTYHFSYWASFKYTVLQTAKDAYDTVAGIVDSISEGDRGTTILTGVATGFIIFLGGAHLAGVGVVKGVVVIASGMFLGGVAGDEFSQWAFKQGLDGPVRSMQGHFMVVWDPKSFTGAPMLQYALYHKETGEFLSSGYATDPTEGGFLPDVKHVLSNGRVVRRGDLRAVGIPRAIAVLCRRLEDAWGWYEAWGYDMPSLTHVAVHTKAVFKPGEDAYWDRRYLHIKSSGMQSLSDSDAHLTSPWHEVAGGRLTMADDNFCSKVAHELWHAIATHGNFNSITPAMDEASAVAFESLVWSGFQSSYAQVQDFLRQYKWDDATKSMRKGLLNASKDDCYNLWSFPKFVFHGDPAGQGTARRFKEFVRGTLDRRSLVELFDAYARTLLCENERLPSIAEFTMPKSGIKRYARTGLGPGEVHVEADKNSPFSFGLNASPKEEFSIHGYPVTPAGTPEPGLEAPVIIRLQEYRDPANAASLQFFVQPPDSLKGSPAPQPSFGGIALPSGYDGQPFTLYLARNENPRPADPVWIYRLTPPGRVQERDLPDGANVEISWAWKDPPGQGPDRRERVGGYYLYGCNDLKNTDARELLAYITFEGQDIPGLAEAAQAQQKHKDLLHGVIVPDATSCIIGLAQLQGMTNVGISCVDRVMRDDQGHPVESPIRWPAEVDPSSRRGFAIEETTFPSQPFNGLQMTFRMEGAKATKTEDSDFIGMSREYRGLLGVERLRVSGTARTSMGVGAEVVVTVEADLNKDSVSYQFKQDAPQSFDVSVPIPVGASRAIVNIRVVGYYNTAGPDGRRSISVRGVFYPPREPDLP